MHFANPGEPLYNMGTFKRGEGCPCKSRGEKRGRTAHGLAREAPVDEVEVPRRGTGAKNTETCGRSRDSLSSVAPCSKIERSADASRDGHVPLLPPPERKRARTKPPGDRRDKGEAQWRFSLWPRPLSHREGSRTNRRSRWFRLVRLNRLTHTLCCKEGSDIGRAHLCPAPSFGFSQTIPPKLRNRPPTLFLSGLSAKPVVMPLKSVNRRAKCLPMRRKKCWKKPRPTA